jgi:hypothetical protein
MFNVLIIISENVCDCPTLLVVNVDKTKKEMHNWVIETVPKKPQRRNLRCTKSLEEYQSY